MKTLTMIALLVFFAIFFVLGLKPSISKQEMGCKSFCNEFYGNVALYRPGMCVCEIDGQ